MAERTIYEILTDTGLPVRYSHFTAPQDPPFLVYTGNGQDQFDADNTTIWRRNTYQVEYYFKTKDEDAETAIEDVLLANGWLFDKSDDTFIESDGVFVIYYTLQ